ncbi:hypothetical protein EGJ51_20935 [Pseudomonas fulva]|uniref:hypothetical protein n=1 Tax=Pseudomonas fulva TaxID=47880 RepID=UPI000F76BCF2|nr:hypothetical protein [Pseudomonas fulva]RRW57087.1 hypothetical protein EGJ51_20935 [Pseudomonas fulva]
MSNPTKPEVFIIESLRLDDKINQRYEGRRIHDILVMSGKSPKYHYFQESSELPYLLELFKQSNYRFLHFSCHAALDKVMTEYDAISYANFSKLLSGYLKLRRAFFSACELGNDMFAQILAAGNKGMHSIAAPAEKIQFDHAAAIWSSFYVSAFSANSKAMKHADIVARLNILCTLFPVNMHFSGYNSRADKWNHQIIQKSALNNAGLAKVKGVIVADPTETS